MKKVVLVGVMILNILNLKAQQEVLDKNDFFDNRPISNTQSVYSNENYVKIPRLSPQILKSSRTCFGIGIATSLLGSILYYNGSILQNNPTPNPPNYYTNYEKGEMQSTLGGALLVIGTGFNVVATIEKFKWEDQITKESLENKLKQESNERKIQELEKQLSNTLNN